MWLAEATDDGTVSFERIEGYERITARLTDLSAADQVTLAELVAHLKPESGDAQAMAGVFLEALGNVSAADKYYAKAGTESREKLEKLFQRL